MNVKISSTLALMFILMLNVVYANANEIITVFDNETFRTWVDNETKTVAHEMNFTFVLPPYKNATLYFSYDNRIDGTVIERCTISQVAIYIGSKAIIAEHYNDVQGVEFQRSLTLLPEMNHSGQVTIFGKSESELVGTVNMHIEIIGFNDGFFNIDFNPLDFGANWWFWGLISGVAVIGTIIAVKKRRSGSEV